ncbi:hypothetical protein [Actinomadura roseirufa]|uniref:hypothetical protein n=1 Tax=Actinomadura roseirufa TaxID=2094049 RepID=UPI001040E571|nr:hypothetical protein [Actinomadura roseirufa]
MADTSGDRYLASVTRSWEAATRLSDPRENPAALLNLAEEARSIAGKTPSLYSAVVKAETSAAAGDHATAVAELQEAEALLERPLTPDRRNHEGTLRVVQSLVYSINGDASRANKAQTTAQSLYRSYEFPSIQLKLHEAILHAPTDPSNALNEAVKIMQDLSPERRIARVRVNARRVINALPGPACTLPAAQDLRTLISAQSPATHL